MVLLEVGVALLEVGVALLEVGMTFLGELRDSWPGTELMIRGRWEGGEG